MPRPAFYETQRPERARRFALTEAFLEGSLEPGARVIDVGPDNAFAERLRAQGYEVGNTGLVDLDDEPEAAAVDADVATAFEIFEHLVNPLGVLRALHADRLFATVPLRLWFRSAYRGQGSDPWDRHFHEFEDWQFDWLLDKAGWDVVRREYWTAPSYGIRSIGVRPLLRRVTPRWYAVEGVRRAS